MDEGVIPLIVEHAIAAGHQPGRIRILLRSRVNVLGILGSAPGLVDVQAIALRVTAQLFDLPRGEVVPVALEVAGVDRELHRVIGERIDELLADIAPGHAAVEATRPGWNGTVGIGACLCAQRRERLC